MMAGTGTHIIQYDYTDGNGCTDYDMQSITVNGLPVVTLSAFADVCEDVAIFALSGGAPGGGTYSGTGVSFGNFDAAIALPGTHNITYDYTDGNGCTDYDMQSITVNGLPMPMAGADAFVCAGGSAQLNATGGTMYTWSPLAGLDDSTIANPVANPGVTTQYLLDVVDGNGCASIIPDTLTVTVASSLTADAGIDTVVCDGSGISMSGSGGGLYSWWPSTGLSDTAVGNPIASPTVMTTYYMAIYSGACSDTDTVVINVNTLPVVTLGAYANVCEDSSSFTLSGGAPALGTYWGTGVSGGNFDVMAAGTGTHTIYYDYTDVNNCTNTDSSTIDVNPLPVAGISESNDTLTSAAATSYQWLLDGGPISGADSGMVVAIMTGNYECVIWDANGCKDTSNSIMVLFTHAPVIQNNATVSIAPNPNNGEFTIILDGIKSSSTEISIFDLTGKTVYRTIIGLIDGSHRQNVNLSHTGDGLYVVTVKTANETFFRKIIKR